MEQHLVNIN